MDTKRLRGLLILRHLADGDAIDYPVPDDHPHARVFKELEAEGWVARWDRWWPMADRYRLTEKGQERVQKLYQPDVFEKLYEKMQTQDLSPADRRAFLRAEGIDPEVAPALHDPSVDWTSWSDDDPGPYWAYVWEGKTPSGRPRKEPRKPERPQRVEDLDRTTDIRDPSYYDDRRGVDVS